MADLNKLEVCDEALKVMMSILQQNLEILSYIMIVVLLYFLEVILGHIQSLAKLEIRIQMN